MKEESAPCLCHPPGLHVGVEPGGASVAAEASVWHFVEDGVVDSGFARHRVPEPGQGVVRVVVVLFDLSLGLAATISLGPDGSGGRGWRPCRGWSGGSAGDEGVLGHAVGVAGLLHLGRGQADQGCRDEMESKGRVKKSWIVNLGQELSNSEEVSDAMSLSPDLH